MKNATISHFFVQFSLCTALCCALRLSADVIETSNGARNVGRIIRIHGGVITLETEYAGKIEVKQALVTFITTDHPVAVRLADGTSIIGMISTPSVSKLMVTGSAKSVECPIGNVAATWAAGEEDPDVIALRRKWSYEAGADINGRSGTQTQVGTSYHFRAKLVGPDDTFQYYTAYTRQATNGQVSADQFKVGVDYADNFTANQSWYVRDESGFDRVNFITLYDIAAGGYGYDFIKQKGQAFTGRLGLSYRYDEYSPGKGPALNSTGADFGLEYMLMIKKAKLTDRLTFVPAFKDLGNYVISQEFAFEVPITKSLWKLSTGVTDNYDSRPVAGVDKLETIYFTRLMLTWGTQ